ncbi:MAG: DNA-3-methyladenine glycosylase 2 family protein [Bacteroidota bacterium]
MGKSKKGSIKKHLAQDPVFAPIVKGVKLPDLELTSDVYHRLLKTIVFQQLSGKAATTIYERFLALFPDGYPYPDHLLQLSIEELRSVGLSRSKAQYVQNVAQHFIDHDLVRQDWSKLRDDEIRRELTSIKGVGNWTAEMILMFALGRKDILPLGDHAIQQSMKQLYRLPQTGRSLQREMERIAQKWRPYRAVACRYLWHWRDTVL